MKKTKPGKPRVLMASAPDSSWDCADQLCQSPKTFAPQGAQPLQTCGLNVSPDEGNGEDRPQAPPPPGETQTWIPCSLHTNPGIGVDDAVIYLLQRSLSHLEESVRITFFDSSSAFNMIHPSLLRVKLERAGASDQLAAWVTNYLTDRPQFVRLQDCVSDVVVLQHWGRPGNSPLTFPLHPVHIRLHKKFVMNELLVDKWGLTSFYASDTVQTAKGVSRSAVHGSGSLSAFILRHSFVSLWYLVCLKEDVSWAVEQWAEGGWMEEKEGSLSKGPAPSPFTSTITTNGGREAGV
ncbi:hypothetical protein L3Q82_022957 [Scortum barcoo]|uniref:Uncharacterized protein n=1 Tax=Scortum barcoo TaxID=214431 RepID=A0ACB8WXK8_9TELE|nr:hypothetical protein L3Q82_022957 [Scortum barcoo]